MKWKNVFEKFFCVAHYVVVGIGVIAFICVVLWVLNNTSNLK